MNTNKNDIANPKTNTKKAVPTKIQPKKVAAPKNPTKRNQPQKVQPKKVIAPKAETKKNLAPKVEHKKPTPKTNVKTGGQNPIQGKKIQGKVQNNKI